VRAYPPIRAVQRLPKMCLQKRSHTKTCHAMTREKKYALRTERAKRSMTYQDHSSSQGHTCRYHKVTPGRISRSRQAGSQDHDRQDHNLATGRITRSRQAGSQDHHRQDHKTTTGRITRSRQAGSQDHTRQDYKIKAGS
jgi:hypothetical protein